MILLLLVVPGVGWGQAVVQQDTMTNIANTSFPYLGPSVEQARMLYTAFGLQYRFFLGAMPNMGGIDALYYLALLATLVGGLLIIFNAKFRAATVLVPWLVLVIIMLFAPFNSRLLFYPVSNPVPQRFDSMLTLLSQRGGLPSQVAAAQGQGTRCSLTTPCGFTPQLVAIHVASMLHLSFNSMFASRGWQGLVGDMRAEAMVRSSGILNAGEAWVGQLNEFVKNNCTAQDLFVADRASITAPGAGAAARPAPTPLPVTTMKDMFAELNRLYQADTLNIAPPLILLPNERNLLSNPDWGARQPGNTTDTYLNGISELHRTLVSAPADQRVVLSTETRRPNDITLDAALQAIANSTDFRRFMHPGLDEGRTSPAFFILPQAANNPLASGNLTRESLRRCYSANLAAAEIGERRATMLNCARQGIPNEQQPFFMPETHRADFQNVFRVMQGEADQNTIRQTFWNKFVTAYLGMPNIQNMPVMRVGFSPANVVVDRGQTLLRMTDPNQRGTCAQEGERLIASMMQIIVSNASNVFGRAVLFDNLGRWMRGEAEAPWQIERAGANGLTSGNLPQGSRSAATNAFVHQYLTVQLEEKLRLEQSRALGAGAAVPQELSPEQRREVLVRGMFDLAHQVSSGSLRRTTGEERAVDALRPMIAGLNIGDNAAEARGETSTSIWNLGNLLTRMFNGLATLLGQTAVWVVSWFYGLFALTYWDFLKIFMDLAVTGLIVFTPVLFLAGLTIPTNAMGVMMIGVVGLFVLKLTAVSMVLLNALGLLMYNIIDTGMMPNTWTSKATLVIAMSGLYTGIIAFTLYLMFKVGDTATFVGKMASIDDAAKEAAKTGVTLATTAIMGGLVLPLAGGLAAGLGSFAAGKGAGAAGLAALNEAKRRFAGAAQRADAAAGGVAGTLTRAAEQQGTPGVGGGTRDRGAIPTLTDLPDTDEARELAEAGDLFDGQPGKQSFFTQDGTKWRKYGSRWLKEEEVNKALKQGFQITSSGQLYSPENGRVADNDLAMGRFEQLMAGTNVGDLLTSDGESMIVREDADGNRYLERVNSGNESSLKGDEAYLNNVGNLTPDQIRSAAKSRLASQDRQRLVKGDDGQWYFYEMAYDDNGRFIGYNLKAVSGNELDRLQRQAANGELNWADVTPVRQGAATAGQTQAQATAQAGAAGQTTQPGAAAGATPPPPPPPPAAAAPAPQQATAANAALEQEIQRLKAEQEKQDLTRLAQTAVRAESQIAELERRKQARENWTRNDEQLLAGLRDFRKNVMESDDIAQVKGAYFKAFEDDKFWDALAKPMDPKPGFLASAAAGALGGFKALGSGASSIPFLGDVMKEVFNEWTEGPQRARMWKVVGGNAFAGAYNAWKLKGDAARDSAYKKELGSVMAGYQYRDMVESGASFRAQHDLARNAAAEAVARQKSEWQAAMYANKGQTFTVQQLEGVGRQSALSKVQSLKVEAGQMQAGFTYMMGRDPMTGKMVEQKVKITTGMLNDLAETGAWKSFGKGLEDQLASHYGIIEKRFFRGGKWSAAEREQDSAKRTAQFIAEDLGTDYTVAGHLKMVEGKAGFMGARGKYAIYRDLRMQEDRVLERFLADPASFSQVLEKLNFDGKVPATLTIDQVRASNDYMAQFKKAARDMVSPDALPLDGLMRDAVNAGRTSVVDRSIMWRFAGDGYDVRDRLARQSNELFMQDDVLFDKRLYNPFTVEDAMRFRRRVPSFADALADSLMGSFMSAARQVNSGMKENEIVERGVSATGLLMPLVKDVLSNIRNDPNAVSIRDTGTIDPQRGTERGMFIRNDVLLAAVQQGLNRGIYTGELGQVLEELRREPNQFRRLLSFYQRP